MINSVEKIYSTINNEFTSYNMTLDNGQVWSVPLDEANRHYQAILTWIADGGTVIDNGGGD